MTAGSGQLTWTPAAGVTPANDAPATGAQLLGSFPPRPVASSWSATEATRPAVLARVLAAPFALDNPASQQTRRLGVLGVLSWLHRQPGESWQQRWRASGAEEHPDWRVLLTAATTGGAGTGGATGAKPLPHLSLGLLVLVCADVIRPNLGWLLRFAPVRRGLAIEMARTRDSAAFTDLNTSCAAAMVGLQTGQQALTRIAVMMAAKGGLVGAVRVGDCVELLQITAGMRTTQEAHAHSPLFYQLLRSRGHLGQDAPAAIEMFSGRGQPSCEQLIDRYRIACRPVRDVLVDYLRERQPSVDFSSLQRFAYLLGKLFWADLEAHHPGIDSLKLPRDVAAAWKQRVMTRTRTATGVDGEQVTVSITRLDGRSVLSAVRSFYLDIAEWADDDPARWGPWALRCPVSASDVSHKKDRSQRKSRMDQRTRERLPVLPTLTAWVEAERNRSAELLATARRTQTGALFTTAGLTLRRAVMKTETTGRIWAEDPASGRRRDLAFEEHRGFWTWAMVEVLRHTGIRIEELTELSHHSLIQYRLPATGELIPLLQITPSKTDTERLLVISPELADVLSAIITRVRGSHPRCRWWCPTTRTNASTTRPCRCCSNGAGAWRTGRSPRHHCVNTSTTPSPRSASSTPAAARCGTPSMTSAGCSSPMRSCTGCRRTSPNSSPDTATSTPPWGIRRSTPKRSSTATGRSSHAAAHYAPARNTAPRPTRNGPSSSATSNGARSPSATADAPTPPRASTNTAAYAARYYAPTPPNAPGSSRSATT